ncbi:hypothetical protein LY90DRAFT_202518 [Neocallimastix californiae]|uniref:Uncharacterized protein n=1 Tax=Neocallimastix californiae TaxID=1754190 RepID=A0A1Y1ZGX9_9FUNG|nr:hypothetical protein LY90DRAFT_202518 [Neocallimastix californiae]|eukprot:ORY09257.1 hypothetical protein LY90DRAFT_202518 [Neocallimastix californiae]
MNNINKDNTNNNQSFSLITEIEKKYDFLNTDFSNNSYDSEKYETKNKKSEIDNSENENAMLYRKNTNKCNNEDVELANSILNNNNNNNDKNNDIYHSKEKEIEMKISNETEKTKKIYEEKSIINKDQISHSNNLYSNKHEENDFLKFVDEVLNSDYYNSKLNVKNDDINDTNINCINNMNPENMNKKIEINESKEKEKVNLVINKNEHEKSKNYENTEKSTKIYKNKNENIENNEDSKTMRIKKVTTMKLLETEILTIK